MMAEYQFKFPDQEEQFYQVASLEDLRKKLKKAAIQANIKSQLFKLSQPKDIYIYGNCSKCHSRIKFRKDGQSYRLAFFQNSHNHRRFKVPENSIIKEYIKNLPANIKLSTMKGMVKQRFNITDQKFYYLNRSVNSSSGNFSELIKELDALSYESRYLPFPLPSHIIPSILLTSSPSMRNNFKLFGQVVAVDVTYNLIKEKINGVGWGIILFMGINAHNHIIPFAFGMINNESDETFTSIFLSFFQMLGGEPETIISDQQTSIKSSLRKLKLQGAFSGNHLHDNFHIYKNIRKKVKNERLRKLLYRAIFTEDRLVFRECIKQAQEAISNENQGKELRQFINKANSVALSRIPATFVGHSVNSSFIEKTNDIVKSHLEYEVPALLCFSQIMKMIEERSLKFKICSFPFEQIFGESQLKLLRFSLCEKTFLHFLKYYIKSLELIVDQEHQNRWIFRNSENEQICQVVLRFERFRCSCETSIKIGIPCAHQINIIRKFKQPMSEYFNKRWFLIDVEEQKKIKYKLGRPRSSRRNTG